jgi:hypothetical protein
VRFKARLDTSHHGPPHPFKDAGVVADSLTGIHNAMKCLFVVNRSCIQSPQVSIQRIQVRRAWRPCNGSSSTYPSVMTAVTENISHSMAKLYRGTIMDSSSYNSRIKCFRAHVSMLILYFVCYVDLVPKVCPQPSVTLCISVVLDFHA